MVLVYNSMRSGGTFFFGIFFYVPLADIVVCVPHRLEPGNEWYIPDRQKRAVKQILSPDF